MKKSGRKKAPQFKLFWKHYVLQSLFATLAVFIVFLFLSLQHAVIIASLGSTVFIVFAMPNSVAANPRNVVGGHLVGLAAGSLCSWIPHSSFLPSTVVYAFAVGLSIFLMVVSDTEHPPASGTALGVVTTGFSLNVTIAVISSAIVLSLIHVSLKSRLKDLT
jgi:CBS-domain-containing membrane protein